MSRPEDQAQECAYVVGQDGLARLSGVHADAWFGLLHVYRHLTRELDAELERSHDLSLSGLELLGRLAAATGRRLRLSQLAGQCGLSLSRVSRIVDAFERRGLVERHACPADARATEAWLTPAGLDLTVEAQARHVADVQRRFFDALDERELRALARAFARLTPSRAATGRQR